MPGNIQLHPSLRVAYRGLAPGCPLVAGKFCVIIVFNLEKQPFINPTAGLKMLGFHLFRASRGVVGNYTSQHSPHILLRLSGALGFAAGSYLPRFCMFSFSLAALSQVSSYILLLPLVLSPSKTSFGISM